MSAFTLDLSVVLYASVDVAVHGINTVLVKCLDALLTNYKQQTRPCEEWINRHNRSSV